MIVLHVDLWVKPGAALALEKTYRGDFRPAISKQRGFMDVALLRGAAERNEYRLVIIFREEKLRQQWVATSLHQQVWSKMEMHLGRYAGKTFEPVPA